MNKASGCDEIPVELFQILKDDAVKVLHSICQQIWKSQQWPRDWKRPVFIPVLKKGSAKDCSNYCTVAFISHTSKVKLKNFQVRLQQYMNCELPNIQAGFRKGRGTRDQIANIYLITEKAREFQKNFYFSFIDYAKALTVWILTNCGKFFKRWEYQTTLPAFWESCMQVKKQQLELVAPTAAYTQSHSRPGRMLSYCIPVAPKALTRTARCTQLPPFSGTEGIAPPRDATG